MAIVSDIETGEAPENLDRPTGVPTHVTVYRTIKDKVLFGDFRPGEAVTIHRLTDELGVSMTPVREAIRRLTAEGALEFQGNRRVSVPVMSAVKFRELTQARLAIEPKLSKMAARVVQPKDIDRLADIDRSLDAAIENGDIQGYMRWNHKFHFALYGLANADIFQSLADNLWLRYGPVSRIICKTLGTVISSDQHQQAVSALRLGDPGGVADAIRSDIKQGFEIVRSNFDWNEI